MPTDVISNAPSGVFVQRGGLLRDNENVSLVDEFSEYVFKLQDEIIKALESLEDKEGGKFKVNYWEHPIFEDKTKIAKGKACVIEGGKVIDKGGVNYSLIKNMQAGEELLSSMLENLPNNLDKNSKYFFDVSGISLILHPVNPYCPTIHMNYRLFELKDASKKIIERWYGGGSDLTPCYIFKNDAIHFHKTLKEVCDRYDAYLYKSFKKNCDDYFYLKYRKEHRGIGGIFFDYQKPSEYKFSFGQFVKECGNNFLTSYLPILKRRKDMVYNEKQVFWQQVRRSRYVEFNLVYDRGTKFGLFSPGVDIDNVLISLPSVCRWVYKYKCEDGSPEEETIETLSKARDWIVCE